MKECRALIEEALKTRFSLTDAQCDQLARYHDLLLDWNTRMNLTAITDTPAVVEKHFLDSLLLLEDVELQPRDTLLDVGTGAGFPGLVLAIARPDIQVDLLDSLAKRIRFLEEVVGQLGLDNVACFHDRAELFAKDKSRRDAYDWVCARAVARLPLLSEYCLPFVKVGGFFIACKGPDGEKEVHEAEKALKTLVSRFEKTFYHHLPSGESRHILLIKKLQPTPKKFPRQAGMAAKKPII